MFPFVITGKNGTNTTINAGLRCGSAASSATDGSHACAAYEECKRNHLQTAALCRQQGLQFIPLIAEAVSGGWGREAMKAWRQLVGTEHLLQCLSVTLQRENARAVLRRLPNSAGLGAPLPDP